MFRNNDDGSFDMSAGDGGQFGGAGMNPNYPPLRSRGGVGGGLFSGGMDRRLSVGSNYPLDAAVADILGRRTSLGGGYDGGGGYDMMARRDSLESTAAVLDACILDLTRRRRGIGAGMSSGGDYPPTDMGPPSLGQRSTNSGLQAALSARQHQLQMQQAELERRQQALELQRQQLLAGLQNTSMAPSLSGILYQESMGSMGAGYHPPMNDNAPFPHEEVMEAMERQESDSQSNQSQQWWVCQICNSKAFASRGEALDHEAICDAVPSYQGSLPSRLEQDYQPPETYPDPDTLGMISRPISLAMPTDKDWLTPLHCFVRRNCVEVFTACPDDVAHPSKGKRKPIQVGQVGIRCPFCHVPGDANNRERGSVYYPTTISSIYNATMNLLQRHLHSCPSVPDDIMDQYQTLKADDARSGTSKQYWMESAKSLGLVDTPTGIRYSTLTPPPLPQLSFHQHATSNAAPPKAMGKSKDDSDDEDAADDDKDSSSPLDKPEDPDPRPLVLPEDKPYATQFSYELLSQMQPCVFTEADRLGKRKGLPPGYAGLACRHCFGGYGSGRFFPSSIKTLSDTSKTVNVLHNHMLKCRKCPQEVKDRLEKYRVHHDDERSKMKFGSQKAYFARIWARLHGANNPGQPRSIMAGTKRKDHHQPHARFPGPPMNRDTMMYGGYGNSGGMIGMGGLDVLSRQAASTAKEGSPLSKRRRSYKG